MTHEIVELEECEISIVDGGLGPVGAYAIAIGLGTVFLVAYAVGYEFGKDLAN